MIEAMITAMIGDMINALKTRSFLSPTLLALIAIALWATLALLGLSLKHIPPFLLTGIALLIGSLLSWPFYKEWKVSFSALVLGIYGLFGFHFLLFIALRYAPPVEANLVNYLWPLGIVVMAPLFLPHSRLTKIHVLAACMGFAGAALAILGADVLKDGWQGIVAKGFAWGYLPALGSAFIWASYSLMSKRLAHEGRGFPTAAIGLFGLVSGVLSLLCHVMLEPATNISRSDWVLLVLMGLGPMGLAFYVWDAALKRGDARQIGILSYITPLASTVLLLIFTGRHFDWHIALATALILGAAVMSSNRKA